jgi:predicted Ser/Thr protein kinase
MATYHFSDLKTDFKKHKRILSFSEYLDLIQQKPQQQLRNSAQYFYAMLENYQSNPPSPRPVIGHQEVKESIQRSLKTFTQQGFNNKLLLLHGPNGSAKSSLVQNVMSGAEHYSQTDEGAIYSFHWIFPHETLTKQNLGIHSKSQPKAYESYAYLTDDQIAAKIPSMLNTHPFLLIPVEQRLPLLEHLLGKTAAATVWSQLSRTLKTGGLPQRCYEIFQTLLNSYQGNIDEVLKHIQVERMYFSKRYRQGLVTIEPQMHVDAQYQLLSYNRSYSQLPASLQSLNLFNLTGDLVQGNRGVVEFSDLLKRPMDAFKYLLVACETGTVTIGSCIAELDTIFIGSANELQLDAFKEFPDFMSFKARMDLIQVPYLLKASEEEKVYEQELQSIAHEKPVAPHTAWLLAHWAVLTRLKKTTTSALS